MEQRKTETFDTGMGKIDAIKVKEEKDSQQEYVEVYPHGVTDPEEMIAWFGNVESFARWISGAEVVGF